MIVLEIPVTSSVPCITIGQLLGHVRDSHETKTTLSFQSEKPDCHTNIPVTFQCQKVDEAKALVVSRVQLHAEMNSGLKKLCIFIFLGIKLSAFQAHRACEIWEKNPYKNFIHFPL